MKNTGHWLLSIQVKVNDLLEGIDNAFYWKCDLDNLWWLTKCPGLVDCRSVMVVSPQT